ncbi:MAG: HAD family phosphatase [Ruminococcaceae bacterium]|nr:HAD family phosphatase [Oscillospiraceae bacterium]
MEITGAIFDMDGTLVDSLMGWDILWKKFGVQYKNDASFRPDDRTEKAIRTLPLKDAMLLVHETCEIGDSGEALLENANRVMAQFYREDVELKSGVKEFLEHCLTCGIKMCVASATAPELLEIVMEKFDMDRYFPKIFSCSEIGKGKEEPDIFVMAHEYLGTPKESTWIFEDSITALETAIKAGYHTVGIYDKYNFNPDKVAKVVAEYIGEGDSFASLIPKIKSVPDAEK